MPLTQQEEQRLAELESKYGAAPAYTDNDEQRRVELEAKYSATVPRQAPAAPRQSGSIFDQIISYLNPQPFSPISGPTGPVTQEERDELVRGGLVAGAGVARYGLPVASGLLAPPAIIPQIAYGLTAGVIGETIAQTAELAGERREEFDPGDIAGSGVRSAAPMLSRGGALVRAAGSALSQGAGAYVGRGLEEGRLPTIQESVTDVGLASTLGGFFGGIGGLAQSGRQAVAGAPLERLQEFEAAGIQPTVGQLFPALAATEQRIASRLPGGPIAARLRDQSNQIFNALRALAPGETANPRSFRDLGDQMADVMGATQGARFERTTNLYLQAQEALSTAQTAAQREVAENALRDLKQRIERQIERFAEQSFRGAIDEALGSVSPSQIMGPAESSGFARQIGEGLRESFRNLRTRMYDAVDDAGNRLIDANRVGFDISAAPRGGRSLRDAAETEINRLASTDDDPAEKLFAGVLLPVLRKITRLPDEVSLNDLRNVRDELFELSSNREVMNDRRKSILAGFRNQVTQTIRDQAGNVLGRAGGEQLRVADEMYSRIRPLFDDLGVSALFTRSDSPQQNIATQMVEDLKKGGRTSQRYAQVRNLIEELERSGAQNVPSVRDLNTIVVQSIMNDVTDPVQRTINLPALAETIGRLDLVSPGFAQELGFGTINETRLLNRITQEFPSARDINVDDFMELLRRNDPDEVINDIQALTTRRLEPNVPQIAREAAVVGTTGLRTDLGRYMAQMNAIGEAEDLAALRTMGLSRETQERLVSARDAARAAGITLQNAERLAAERTANPILRALNLVDEGVGVGVEEAERFYRRINTRDPQFIGTVQNWLQNQADAGSDQARILLADWRRRTMEDLLNEATRADARGRLMNARNIAEEFTPDNLQDAQSLASRFRAALGPDAFNEFEQIYLPVLRQIGIAQQEAGMTGGFIRGEAPERAIRQIGEAARNLASGNVPRATMNLVNAWLTTGFIRLAARVFTANPTEAQLQRIINGMTGIERVMRAGKPAVLEDQLMDILGEEE